MSVQVHSEMFPLAAPSTKKCSSSKSSCEASSTLSSLISRTPTCSGPSRARRWPYYWLGVLSDGATQEDVCAGDKAGVAELRAAGAHFGTPLAFVLVQVACIGTFLRAVHPLVFLRTGRWLVDVGRLAEAVEGSPATSCARANSSGPTKDPRQPHQAGTRARQKLPRAPEGSC